MLDYDEEERLEGIELLGQFRMRLIYNESGDRIIRIEEEEYGNYSDRINYDLNMMSRVCWCRLRKQDILRLWHRLLSMKMMPGISG